MARPRMADLFGLLNTTEDADAETERRAAIKAAGIDRYNPLKEQPAPAVKPRVKRLKDELLACRMDQQLTI